MLNLTRRLPQAVYPSARRPVFKPRTFLMHEHSAKDDDYQYKMRRDRLEEIYDSEDNLHKANFVLSYAGRSTLAPWSTKNNYEYLTGTKELLHMYHVDEGRDNSKMLLSMYMFSSDLFTKRRALELIPILSNFRNLDVDRHERSLREIDPRCPMWFLSKNKSCTYHQINEHIVPYWHDPDGEVKSDMICLGLHTVNTAGGHQEVVLSYIIAGTQSEAYAHGLINGITLDNLDSKVDSVFQKIDLKTTYVFPFIHNGIVSATNTYLAFRQHVEDEDALAEDVLYTGQESLYMAFYESSGRRHLIKRQEEFALRYSKNVKLLQAIEILTMKYTRRHLRLRNAETASKIRKSNIIFPKAFGNAQSKTKWHKSEYYPALYGLIKSPETSLGLTNDTTLKQLGRTDPGFQERLIKKLDPQYYYELIRDWKVYRGKNYLIELSQFMEYFRYHIDLMAKDPIDDIPFEDHKKLGNIEYEKNKIFGSIKDYEIEYLKRKGLTYDEQLDAHW